MNRTVRMRYCAICGNRFRVSRLSLDWCAPCRESYDKDAHDEGSVYEAMVWAANRAREAERARAAKAAKK